MSASEIIILEESASESIKRDAFSVLSAFTLIGPGIFMHSNAMQWLGFLMFAVVIIARATGVRKKMTYSIEGARRRIDEISSNPKRGK